MRTSTRRIFVFAALFIVGVVLYAAAVTWPWRRGHFHVWPDETGTDGGLVFARDQPGNGVLLDLRTNTLFIALNGQTFGVGNSMDERVSLTIGATRFRNLGPFQDDLLIGGTDEKIHQFKLPRDAAKGVFLAVWDQRRDDVRPLLLEAYHGPDKEELREILERGQPATDTQPASAPSNGP